MTIQIYKGIIRLSNSNNIDQVTDDHGAHLNQPERVGVIVSTYRNT